MKDMYAHDLTLQYDANLLTFVSAESLQEGITILDTRNESGQLRLILAGKGQPLQGNQDLIKLTFDTNKVKKTKESSINIVGARIGDVRGDEVEAVSNPYEYTLKANAEEPGEQANQANLANPVSHSSRVTVQGIPEIQAARPVLMRVTQTKQK